MKQYETPAAVDVAPDDNAVAALFANAQASPNHVALAYRDGDRFVDVTTAEFAATVRELATGLVGLGVQPGDRVAIFMPTRIEFTYLDYAIWTAGATAVTIYETSSSDQVEWILGDSGATVLICGDAELRARYDEVADQLASCKDVFVIDDGGLDALREAGRSVDASVVDERIAGISHDDVATLVYTSGTTGRPKGCIVTHGNLIADVRQVVSTMEHLFTSDGSTLMFLPLAHILARVVQVACVTRGVKIGFSTGIAELVPELSLLKPTWVFSVPRVFEKVFNTAQGSAGQGLQRKIFDRAVDVAVANSQQTVAGSVKWTTRIEHAVYDRLVYSKLRSAFGGDLAFAISGGAPLGERLGHFFHGAGVLILEGYGLTETTAAATLNTPDAFRIGTVGKPIPGASVKIADDGEILLKGPMVFRGYWNNDEATAEALSDGGWFSSGDIGEIDDDGYVRITGRKKELIVTAAGKNVAPAVLEDIVRAHPLVSQALVVGDQQPFIAALVTLDVEELAKWAEAKGTKVSASDELASEVLAAEEDALRTEIGQAIEGANRKVSKAESIREFRILATDFTIESGELTPTLKMKRSVVMENHASAITDIYGG